MPRWLKGTGSGLLALALGSCSHGAGVAAAKVEDKGAAQVVALTPPPAPISTSPALKPAQPNSPFAPMCKTDGCCAGHGDVAYVQRDFAIICTDGQASDICDCHT